MRALALRWKRNIFKNKFGSFIYLFISLSDKYKNQKIKYYETLHYQVNY